jgi:hypothetical protein
VITGPPLLEQFGNGLGRQFTHTLTA